MTCEMFLEMYIGILFIGCCMGSIFFDYYSSVSAFVQGIYGLCNVIEVVECSI